MPNRYTWPLGPDASPQEIHRLYDQGFPGCTVSPATVEAGLEAESFTTYRASAFHLRGLHTRVPRVLLFASLRRFDPLLYGDERQQTGNCVGRGSQVARATTNAVEIDIRGEPEQYLRPAWEVPYRLRGHKGAGMDPARAARIDAELGFLWRKRYPFADLSQENYPFGTASGRLAQEILDEMAEHKVGRWVLPENVEEGLDLLAAGYACHSGQNVGFSDTPDNRGIHRVRGQWNHDMPTVGYDLTREIWPVPVVFVPNSWGEWNAQPKRWPSEWGPTIPGLIVAELDAWGDYMIGSRACFFYCDVEGIPSKTLPDWGYDRWA
jgi:hypothetical protein